MKVPKAALPLLLASTASGAPLTRGNTEFALRLYGRLASEKGNLFFSPYSISSALAMTYAGAGGETARQMARTLGFPATDADVHAAFSALSESLDEEGRGGKVQLSVANALWGQAGFGFREDFLGLARRYYGAGLRELDFQADTEAARCAINAWVERETKHKIEDLIAPGVLNRNSRLVLTNAIYFKGTWSARFEKSATREETFQTEGQGKVLVPLMRQMTRFPYAEAPECQILELPYVDGRLSLVVLLPRVPGLSAFESALTEEKLSDWLGKLRPMRVDAYLPRFKALSEFQLAPVLAGMGMSTAFDPKEADFSGMDGKRDLVLSQVIHKAFAEVNEEGTEAAAATAVHMVKATAMRPEPPVVFRADRPFIYLIRDRESGSILFLGRLMRPG